MADTSPDPGRAPRAEIDTSVPHSARVWNYLLEGKDNFAVDRQAGDKVREIFPGMVDIARQSRSMLARAVRHLTGEAGIRGFLDIGTGLPTAQNTPQVAQKAAPGARDGLFGNQPLGLV